MTRSCASSSLQPSAKRQPSAMTSHKASQDIPKTSCTRKGSFKQERKDKSKQFFLWQLKTLVPGVSIEDKLSELEIVERTISYIQFLQARVKTGEEDGMLLELLQGLSVST